MKKCSILAILWLVISAGWAAAQVNPVELINTAAANAKRLEELGKNYTFFESQDISTYDKHGRVNWHGTLKYESVSAEGVRYMHLIERDGKPLSGMEAEEERARFDQSVAKQREVNKKTWPVPRVFQSNFLFGGRYRGLRVNLPLAFEDLPRLFDVKFIGIEKVNERPAYVIEATPRPDARPTDKWDEAELCEHVKIWIDVTDVLAVRLHHDLISDYETLQKGSSFDAEGEKINGEIWAFTRSKVQFKVKNSRTSLTGQTEQVLSDFKKFGVETRLLTGSALADLSAPGNAVPSTSSPLRAADEAAIRSMVQKGIEAFQHKDSQSLFSLFSGTSPTLLVLRSKIQGSWARLERIDLTTLNIREISVAGGKASVRISYLVSAANQNGSGAEVGGERKFYAFELVRDDGIWKLWSAFSEEEKLAGDLVAADSEEERDRLLNAEASLVTGELVGSLVEQGGEFIDMGQYEDAITSFKLACKIAERLQDRKALCEALYGLGRGNLAQGNEAVAEDYFQQSLAICEALGDPSILAAGFPLLGRNYADRGDYRRAMQYYQKGLKISTDIGNKEDLAINQESIGDLFAQEGNDEQAHEFYQKSLRLSAELEAGVDFNLRVARTLGKIADTLSRQGHYAKALDNYTKSLKSFQDLAYKPGIALTFRSIGDSYFRQGQLDQALHYYQESLDRYEEIVHQPGTAMTLSRIGNVYYKRGDYGQAIEFCNRAAELTKGLDNAPYLSWILTNLGTAYLAAKKYDRAQETLAAAISNVETLRTHVVGTEQDEALFFEREVDPYYAMVELLIAENRLTEALAYAERAKSRVLLDVLRNGREDIAKTLTPDEQAKERSVNGVILALDSRLRQESMQRQPDPTLVASIAARLKKTRLEYDALRTTLYAAHPNLQVQRGEATTLLPDELETLIPDAHTTFLEYLVTPQKTYVFVLSRNLSVSTAGPGKVAVKVYPIEVSALDLATRVARLRAALATNALDFREPARRLYDLLLAPAQKDLTGRKTICVIPSGPLWELPFQALLSKSNRYTLQDHAVFYVPSLSVLREMTRKAATGDWQTSQADDPAVDPTDDSVAKRPTASSSQRLLFAVGDPAVNDERGGEARATGRTAASDPLFETGKMVRTLGQIYGLENSMVLTGPAAQEETVRAEAGHYKILHFATHGLLDNDDPLYSRLLLARSNQGGAGFLEARDLMQMDLHADLAVLSACETARGRVSSGEGLIGMSWALFVAGTPAIVVSQWKVDAASTSSFMIAFHRLLKSQLSQVGGPPSKGAVLRHPVASYRLLKSQSTEAGSGITKAEILRAAALKLMARPEYRHPFYWAGFVVMGDGL